MNKKTEDKKRYSSLSPAVEQAAEILKYLASGSHIKANLTEISKMVGINKSKTFAILGALQNTGFVTKDAESKSYSLGPEIIPIAQTALKNIDYRNDAKPFLERLAKETLCTVMFGVIYDERIIIISKQASGQEVDSSIDIGMTRNIFHKAHGVAILASLPREEQEALLSGEDFFNDPDTGIIKNSELRKEIKEVKGKGYAVTRGSFSPMINVLSSAVIGHRNRPIGALIIIGLIEKSNISKYGEKLVMAAKGLSSTLGAHNR